MDLTDLRVERIRTSLLGARETVNLHAKRHATVLAVALTLAGSSLLAGFAGQLPAVASAGGALAAGAVVGMQVRALGGLSRAWKEAVATAETAIDSLMTKEGDQVVDGTPMDSR